jgi:hypothetical protein
MNGAFRAHGRWQQECNPVEVDSFGFPLHSVADSQDNAAPAAARLLVTELDST